MRKTSLHLIILFIYCCFSFKTAFAQSSISSSTIPSGTGLAADTKFGYWVKSSKGGGSSSRSTDRRDLCKPGASLCSSSGSGAQITITAGSVPAPICTWGAFNGPSSYDSFGNLQLFIQLDKLFPSRPSTSDSVTYDWLHNCMRSGYMAFSDQTGYFLLDPSICTPWLNTINSPSQMDGDYTSAGLKIYYNALNTVNVINGDTNSIMITFFGVIPGYKAAITFDETNIPNSMSVTSLAPIPVNASTTTDRAYFRYQYITEDTGILYMYLDAAAIVRAQPKLATTVQNVLASKNFIQNTSIGYFPINNGIIGVPNSAYYWNNPAGNFAVTAISGTTWFYVAIPVNTNGQLQNDFKKPKKGKK